jgi:dihydroflavonol-4-reductase
METVLVTGGSGYLGGWCVVELLRRGYAVRTTVRDLAREAEVRAAVSAAIGTGNRTRDDAGNRSEVDAGDRAEDDIDDRAAVDLGERLTVLRADLLADDGWDEGAAGCDFVLHVASPFPPTPPEDPDELIVPARDGTLRVLRASLDAGARRIVVTSSVAAITGGTKPAAGPLTEEDWSDPDNPRLSAYACSKTIAERAAWDFMRERGATEKLVTVNPGAIIGPVLGDARSYSLQSIERLLGGIPGVPRIGFSFVDVRDVADLEIRAMTAPEAAGERFIAVVRFLWMAEVAAILRDRLGEDAAKVPTRAIPNLLVRAMAIFDPGIRSILGQLGRRTSLSSEKAQTQLGWRPRPIEDTIAECAHSLLSR